MNNITKQIYNDTILTTFNNSCMATKLYALSNGLLKKEHPSCLVEKHFHNISSTEHKSLIKDILNSPEYKKCKKTCNLQHEAFLNRDKTITIHAKESYKTRKNLLKLINLKINTI